MAILNPKSGDDKQDIGGGYSQAGLIKQNPDSILDQNNSSDGTPFSWICTECDIDLGSGTAVSAITPSGLEGFRHFDGVNTTVDVVFPNAISTSTDYSVPSVTDNLDGTLDVNFVDGTSDSISICNIISTNCGADLTYDEPTHTLTFTDNAGASSNLVLKSTHLESNYCGAWTSPTQITVSNNSDTIGNVSIASIAYTSLLDDLTPGPSGAITINGNTVITLSAAQIAKSNPIKFILTATDGDANDHVACIYVKPAVLSGTKHEGTVTAAPTTCTLFKKHLFWDVSTVTADVDLSAMTALTNISDGVTLTFTNTGQNNILYDYDVDGTSRTATISGAGSSITLVYDVENTATVGKRYRVLAQSGL